MSIWLRIFGPEPWEFENECVYIDYDTPNDKPPYSQSCSETHLAGGKGIGKSIESDRGTTEAFGTLANLTRAYWDHRGIGPAMLELRRRELDDRERRLKRSSLYQAVSFPELIKIKSQRKELQDREKELEIRIHINYIKERYRRRHQKGLLLCERESSEVSPHHA
ncbi:hypothetical protein SLS62_007690 [Diatrype stigma]|uniref:Uncharacterized protein n=1 Tax=Diatrype stigma TaxID=117547 RepID=A0AAN9UNU9_9PEZI